MTLMFFIILRKTLLANRKSTLSVPQLPLNPEQLENVFDQLDQDQNGYLTLEEFTKGFESFLGIENHSTIKVSYVDRSVV